MSNEITLQTSVIVSNGYLNEAFAPGNILVNQNNPGRVGGVFLITTADTVIPNQTPIATNGFVCMRNLDATNYIKWGPQTGSVMVPAGLLKPGETTVFRAGLGVTYRAQAMTASCRLEVRFFED
jgi:hypothetical protein